MSKNHIEMTKHPPKVLVVLTLSTISGRDFLTGILNGINREWGWELQLFQDGNLFSVSTIERLIADGYAGIIIHDSIPTDAINALAQTSLAIIHTSTPLPTLSNRPSKNTAFIFSDNKKIGEMAADHLRSCGNFNSFAFVSSRDHHTNLWSVERGKAFQHQIRVPVCFGIADAKIGDFLSALSKPSAIMADCDKTAAVIAEAAANLSIDIPQQLAVIGVDNDEFLCALTSPRLSSIQTGHQNMGIAAVQRLHEILSGKTTRKITRVEPGHVIIRESTAFHSPSAQLVNKANAYIKENACLGCKVPDVIRHLGVSRRLAELRYREIEHQTIRTAIETCRLEEAKRLLKRTSLPLKEIATRSGFSNEFRLCQIFRQRFGRTARSFRESPP